MPRNFLTIIAALALAGCGIVYKLPTRQGNIIDQKEVEQVKVGMTKDQVRFLLGTPIATSSFDSQRWDYFGYYKPPRGDSTSRVITLYFEGDKLARLEGDLTQGNSILGTPDLSTFEKQSKKDKTDKSRDENSQQSGVNIPTPAP
jgi:outer membrane protein assembly factor BamE (lipoprotein component of BamABCDE complex)